MTRILIINPMQSPPGIWLATGKDTKGNRCVTPTRELALAVKSKAAAEIETALFEKNYPQRGKERLTFLFIETED